jgi:hypothetical protein
MYLDRVEHHNPIPLRMICPSPNPEGGGGRSFLSCVLLSGFLGFLGFSGCFPEENIYASICLLLPTVVVV